MGRVQRLGGDAGSRGRGAARHTGGDGATIALICRRGIVAAPGHAGIVGIAIGAGGGAGDRGGIGERGLAAAIGGRGRGDAAIILTLDRRVVNRRLIISAPPLLDQVGDDREIGAVGRGAELPTKAFAIIVMSTFVIRIINVNVLLF